jgi:1,4-alpha-glucan branching enzyme
MFLSRQRGEEAMNDARWRAKKADVAAIIGARHEDPFAILGLHRVDAGFVMRALVPDAERVVALDRDDKIIIALERREGSDFFEGLVKIRTERFTYRLRAENSGGSWIFHDPYAHGPVLGPMDDYLLVEGTPASL